jgi:tRNA (cmo5U34)-methyltransferase
MPAEIWQDRDVAQAFLSERSLMIPYREQQLETMLRLVRFYCCSPARVLDLGAGDGIQLGALLEAFPQTEGLAVDFSPLMLEQARKRLAKFGARAATATADLQTSAWRKLVAGPYNAVVSSLAIHHLPDERKRELYGEIYGLLTAGGIFVNIEHVASPSPRLQDLFDHAMSEHLYRRRLAKGEPVTLEGVYRDFMERPDRAANILAPFEEQCRWLTEIGFREVDCYWKWFELAIFGGVK